MWKSFDPMLVTAAAALAVLVLVKLASPAHPLAHPGLLCGTPSLLDNGDAATPKGTN